MFLLRRSLRVYSRRFAWPLLYVAVACGAASNDAPSTTIGADSEPVATATTFQGSDDAVVTTSVVSGGGAGGTRENPVALGSAAQVGDWVIQVSSVSPDGADAVMAENQFNDPPAEGHQFFLVGLEATYVGEESATFWVDLSIKALGDSNVAYESFDAYCGLIPDAISDEGETFPGGTVSGNECWSIEAGDADSLVLIIESSFAFDDNDRTFFATL